MWTPQAKGEAWDNLKRHGDVQAEKMLADKGQTWEIAKKIGKGPSEVEISYYQQLLVLFWILAGQRRERLNYDVVGVQMYVYVELQLFHMLYEGSIVSQIRNFTIHVWSYNKQTKINETSPVHSSNSISNWRVSCL